MLIVYAYMCVYKSLCVCVCMSVLRVFPELVCHFGYSLGNALCFARHNKFDLPSIVGNGDLCLCGLAFSIKVHPSN